MSKYPRCQESSTMNAQLPITDTMNISTEIANNNSITTPLFAEDVETSPSPKAKNLDENSIAMAEKDKEKEKSEEKFVNLHNSNTMAHEVQ